MRLNKYDRDAFVRSAMNDVPEIDFNVKAQKLIIDHLKATLPVDLQNAIAKYPDWFPAHHINTPSGLSDFATRLIADAREYRNLTKWPDLLLQVRLIAEESSTQHQQRTTLEAKLRAAIGPCTTLKQALELLPEFAKYLPTERDGDKTCRQMPAVANLVADLMNAGWPKKEK